MKGSSQRAETGTAPSPARHRPLPGKPVAHREHCHELVSLDHALGKTRCARRARQEAKVHAAGCNPPVYLSVVAHEQLVLDGGVILLEASDHLWKDVRGHR